MILVRVDVQNSRAAAELMDVTRQAGHEDFKLVFHPGYTYYVHLFAWPRRILITSAHNGECVKYGRMIPARWPHSKTLFEVMEAFTKGEVV